MYMKILCHTLYNPLGAEALPQSHAYEPAHEQPLGSSRHRPLLLPEFVAKLTPVMYVQRTASWVVIHAAASAGRPVTRWCMRGRDRNRIRKQNFVARVNLLYPRNSHCQ